MKTKWKKYLALSMLGLFFSTSFLPDAKAGIFENEVLETCYVQVLLHVGGNDPDIWMTVLGAMESCVPEIAYCSASPCAPMAAPTEY